MHPQNLIAARSGQNLDKVPGFHSGSNTTADQPGGTSTDHGQAIIETAGVPEAFLNTGMNEHTHSPLLFSLTEDFLIQATPWRANQGKTPSDIRETTSPGVKMPLTDNS